MISLRPVLGSFVQMPTATTDRMDHIPEEVVLQILSYLDHADLVSLQRVSLRYLKLGRDDTVWKRQCFNQSRAGSARRRQQLLNLQDSRLVELRNAVSALPGSSPSVSSAGQLSAPNQNTSTSSVTEARIQQNRALANWEPGYPREKLDYYEEYAHRHAPISTAWLNLPKDRSAETDRLGEATGVGMLSLATAQHVVAPLDDGSICIWDVSRQSTAVPGGGGRLIAQSKSGLLSGQSAKSGPQSHAIMTETGAVESVSIDSAASKGYFAVQHHLHEVDLANLQVIYRKRFPWPITALSESTGKSPITVGTNCTIHLYDPRDPTFAAAETASDGQLIGGSVYSHATLAQPGPLSILNHNGFGTDDCSIWVAGRFTSILNYDRRFFPRLRRTIFSGARIASLAALDYPYIPRNMDLLRNPDATLTALQEAKSSLGTTILAAAEYKGKGSLELIGLPGHQSYQNRQTASASKLLSVAPHGGRIVFSDGDGNLKWVERDGFTHVRTFNINDTPAEASATSPRGLFPSSASEMPGQGDIVQKILPTSRGAAIGTSSSGRPDVNQDNLLLWTGDGRLGVLGFGHRSPLGEDRWHDALEEQQQAQSAQELAREDAERQYGMAMRRALERNADEVRFVRGLGMGV